MCVYVYMIYTAYFKLNRDRRQKISIKHRDEI